MSPFRCESCERNVSIEIQDATIEDYEFDEDDGLISVNIHLELGCAECGDVLVEYDGTSELVIPQYEAYLDFFSVDSSEVEINEPEITVYRTEKRKGIKTYISDWSTIIKYGSNERTITGELAVTQKDLVG